METLGVFIFAGIMGMALWLFIFLVLFIPVWILLEIFQKWAPGLVNWLIGDGRI